MILNGLLWKQTEIILLFLRLPGSSPGGSREIRRVNGVGEESLFIWKYKIRLGRNRVVGKFSGEKSLNNLVYGESQ